jgi:hypothetical protein
MGSGAGVRPLGLLLWWACRNDGSGVPDAILESCNGEDDDGDGLVDEDARDAAQLYTDDDGDGFGAEPLVEACLGSPGTAQEPGDCDDGNPGTWPGAPDVCGDGARDCDAWTPCRYGSAEQMRHGGLVVDSDWPDRAHFSAAAGLGDLDGDGLDDIAFGGNHHSTHVEFDGATFV